MDIFVASTSFHKTTPTREAGQEVFPNMEIHVEGKPTKSGVNAEPVTTEADDETLRGACNRMDDLINIIGETRYDLLVAIENGIKQVKVNDRVAWFDFAWIVVQDAQRNRYYANSIGIEIPADIVEEARLIIPEEKRFGFQNTTIGDIIARRGLGTSTGPHAALTSYLLTRSDLLGEGFKTILGILFLQLSTKNLNS